MKAIVLRGKRSIDVEEVQEPNPKEGEALVEVRAVGVCGTDLEIYQGRHPRVSRLFAEGRLKRLILGHEWSGVVLDVRGEVGDLRPGDRVTSETTIPCCSCYYCSIGRPNLCDNAEEIGITRDGAMADRLAVPAKVVHRIPTGLSFEEAAMVEPLAVALHAVEVASGQTELSGRRVGIFGDGTVGLLILQLVLREGPREVLLFGKSDYKLRLAERFGEVTCVNTGAGGQSEVINRIKRAIGPIGADVVIEAAPGCSVVEEVLHAVRKGGLVVLVGLHEGCVLDVDAILFKELVLMGSLSSTPTEWNRAIELAATKQVDLGSLISQEVSLEGGCEFIKGGGRPDTVKTIIRPSE